MLNHINSINNYGMLSLYNNYQEMLSNNNNKLI